MPLRRALPALLALSCVAGLTATGVTLAAGAQAAARPAATFSDATQDTFRHVLWVQGHAIDPSHPTRSIGVRLYVDGHYRAQGIARTPSVLWNRAHHVSGAHGYRFALPYPVSARSVSIVADGARTPAVSSAVRHVWPSAGTRITYEAARYVGHARYVEGGASPKTGFDCSGYTRYVYLLAHVRTLPHNAQAQRFVHGMHRVSAASARPGDLVFYLSGGHAYHVAVYAGHGKQYAAATPRDGIRYQPIWSRSVEYRTVLH